jgi:hypothetical protein
MPSSPALGRSSSRAPPSCARIASGADSAKSNSRGSTNRVRVTFLSDRVAQALLPVRTHPRHDFSSTASHECLLPSVRMRFNHTCISRKTFPVRHRNPHFRVDSELRSSSSDLRLPKSRASMICFAVAPESLRRSGRRATARQHLMRLGPFSSDQRESL